MRLTVPIIVSAILIVCMVGVSLWAVMVLPAATQVVIHWGPGGVPNNFASVPIAFSIGPLIALTVSVVFAILMRFATTVQAGDMPNLRARLLVIVIVWIVAVVVIAGVHTKIIYSAISGVHGPLLKSPFQSCEISAVGQGSELPGLPKAVCW